MELRGKQFRLRRFDGAVADGSSDFAWIIQRHLGVGRRQRPQRLRPGEAMMIEPDFANGDNPRAFGELTQLLEAIGRRFHGMIRMNPDDREDVRMRVGNGQCATAPFDGRSDGDDPRDTGIACAGNDGVQIRSELGKIKVRMRIDQHHQTVKVFLKERKRDA